MSATVQQIYALNPSTTIHNNDLIYIVQSPYTPGTDSAIKGSDLIAQFEGLPITLTNSHIFVGNVSNVATDVAMSGDATIANTGALTVSAIGGKAVTLGGAFTTSGAFAVTQAYTGATNVTFPTTGTLATTSQLPTPSALTSANDTNVTITLGGTPATSLLQAVSLTMGWTGLLGGSRGGTGVNNGTSTITVGGNVAFSGAFTFTGTLTNNTAVTFPTSGTLATTSQLPTPAALTSSNDTNVTITLGGTPATALLQATSLTMGWTGTLAVGRGGTGAASFNTNGIVISNTTTTGALAALSLTDGQLVIGSSIGAPLAATLTAGAGISVTNGHNTITIAAINSGTVTSISAGTGITCTPNPITGTGTVALTTPVSLANGGTNASLTANNGGILYSTASAVAILAGTATANQVLLSGSSAAPAWSTATYPATTTINQILYSSATNTVTGISSVNSAVLSTNGSGVPAFSTTLPSGIAATNMSLTTPALGTPSSGTLTNCTGLPVSTGISGLGTGVATWLATPSSANLLSAMTTKTGTGLLTFATSPSITTGLNDTNGNNWLGQTATGSAVNYVNVTNNSTTNKPIMAATGSDSNVLLSLQGKGNSGVEVQGTTAAGNATAGFVGEFVSSTISSGSAVSLTNNTNANVTSISLTAGDWDVIGNVSVVASGNNLQASSCWVSTTSATLPDVSLRTLAAGGLLVGDVGLTTNFLRVNVSSTTTVFLSCQATFATGTATACGGIFARRVR